MDESRKIIGSWIEGPRAGAEQLGADFGYRGRRLGLPEEGPGSIASTGRRLVAVLIDWWLCALISYGLIAHRNPVVANYWTMFVFFVLSVLTMSAVGSTPGKRLLGLRVVRLDGGRASIAQILLRTVLLLLAVPALVWDRDGRGLHDKAVATVEVRI
ncbi:RDD family protein [Streptacidiphilus sp. PB12-B1b]|uniref:RDD family protein n=1 Tax=Streptacidiphilus sp. PB12-B1b TaxID=2705012 RepID=UPI0015F92E91|nr:RDD family protein [Streptacidiphilus sp. PB12-B1b]QMU75829.1 RDD family protein [Streptacidiphilus sp. PB12-B1b]